MPEVIADLSAKLCAITGFDAVSLQPNSGAQGEYAGLLAIRAWHRSNGAGRTAMCVSFRPRRTAPIQRRRTWRG